MQNYKDYITKQDIQSKIPNLSTNIKDTDISAKVQESMIEELRYILSSNLYDTLMYLYSIEKNVTSIIAGATTIINVSNVDGIDTLYKFKVSQLVGTISAMNDKEFEVLNVSGTAITVNFDSTGLAWSSGGVLTNWQRPELFELRSYIVPFLIYSAYVRYSLSSSNHQTPYGLVQKNNQYSEYLPNQKEGVHLRTYQKSMSFWKEELTKYLHENQNILTPFGYVSENFVYNNDMSFSPIYSKDRHLLRNFRTKTRWGR